jgi:hypothetical protein
MKGISQSTGLGVRRTSNGAVAHLGERCFRTAEVEGSNPFSSTWGHSSSGRAARWQRVGGRFESDWFHYRSRRSPLLYGELVRARVAPPSLTGNYGVLAQLGERLHGMQKVVGSIPTFSTHRSYAMVADWIPNPIERVQFLHDLPECSTTQLVDEASLINL